MFTLNRTSRNALSMIVILLVVISALAAFRTTTTSKYQPKPITVRLSVMLQFLISQSAWNVLPGLGKKIVPTPRVSHQVVSVAPRNS